MGSTSLIAWRGMSPRQQAVWSAAYAASGLPPMEAARHADNIATSLSNIEWPEQEEPEHRAARLCAGLSAEEFAAWYRVEFRMTTSRRAGTGPTDEEIKQAYTTYVMCGCDFY